MRIEASEVRVLGFSVVDVCIISARQPHNECQAPMTLLMIV